MLYYGKRTFQMTDMICFINMLNKHKFSTLHNPNTITQNDEYRENVCYTTEYVAMSYKRKWEIIQLRALSCPRGRFLRKNRNFDLFFLSMLS